jgi:membrane-bound metal-dependent hydrolase YbcI (DUF457 family)
MVGLTAAAACTRVTGAEANLVLWIGAIVASGAPDLDIILVLLGLDSRRFHRSGAHSLVVIAAGALALWGLGRWLPVSLDGRVLVAWLAALISHPLLDVITTGPGTAARGYGIALLWPLSRRRWFLERPVLDQDTDWVACRTARDVWVGLRPEVVRLALPCAAVIALSLGL